MSGCGYDESVRVWKCLSKNARQMQLKAERVEQHQIDDLSSGEKSLCRTRFAAEGFFVGSEDKIVI